MRYLFLLFVCLSTLSYAQATNNTSNTNDMRNTDVTTIVVLPFDAQGNSQGYGLSLSIALARHLNLINNVYAPPVGDVLQVVKRLQAEGTLGIASLAEQYQAEYIISGRVRSAGSTEATVLLGFADARATFDDLERSIDLNNPEQVITSVVLAALSGLKLDPSPQDRSELESLARQIPSLPSLQVVSQSASRVQVPDFSQLEAAANLDATSSWVLSERARATTLRGTLADAQTLAEQAVAYAPQDIEAWLVLGQITAARRDLTRSQEAVTEMLTLNPGHAEAWLLQGQIQALQADTDQAQRSLERALTVHPRLANAYLSLAGLQTGTAALQTLNRAMSFLPEVLEIKQAFLQQANAAGDSAGAESYLRALLSESQDPQDYLLVTSLADDALALNLAQEGQRRFATSALPLLAEAALRVRQADNSNAIMALTRALALEPNNLTVRNQLAVTYARNGQLDQAEQVLQENSNSSTLQYNLAQVYLEAGQYQAAVDALEPLLESYRNDPQALTSYAIALAQLGRNDQAQNVIEQALALNPNDDGLKTLASQLQGGGSSPAPVGAQQVALSDAQRVAFERGLAYLEANQPSQAITEFRNARASEDNGLLAFYEGFAAQASGDSATAVAAYLKARDFLGESATLLNNLGFAYYQQGELAQAVQYLERAVALEQDNAQSNLNLALVQTSLGNPEAALPALERALRLEPNLAETQVAISQVDEAGERRSEQLSLSALRSRLAGGAAATSAGEMEAMAALLPEQATPYFEDGLKALERNDLQAATDAFAQAQTYGESPLLAFYHGFALQGLKRYDEAITAYQLALAAAPESAIVLNNLGFAHYLKGEAEQGINYLARAVQADPNHIQAHINLGLVNYSLGRFRSALTPLQRALELEPAVGESQLTFSDGSSATLRELISRTEQALTP